MWTSNDYVTAIVFIGYLTYPLNCNSLLCISSNADSSAFTTQVTVNNVYSLVNLSFASYPIRSSSVTILKYIEICSSLLVTLLSICLKLIGNLTSAAVNPASWAFKIDVLIR